MSVTCRGAMGGLPAAHERLPADGLPSSAGTALQEDLPGPPPGSPRASQKRSWLRDDSPVHSSKHKSEQGGKKAKKSKREKREKRHKREKQHSKEKRRKRYSKSP